MSVLLSAVTLLAAAGATAVQPQLRPEIVQAERAKLLKGVETIPKTGVPGPVGIWGGLAFPVIAGPDDRGNELPLVAAAGYGKGRIILFGHNGYLAGSLGSDASKLLENCLRWTGKKESPRLGTKGVQNDGFLKEWGFSVKRIDGGLDAGALRGFDVVLVNAQGLTDAKEGEALIGWVEKGGGLVAGMTGWAYSQTSGGKDLTSTHGLQRAMAVAGVGFTEEASFADQTSFQAREKLPPLLNASEALTAIKKQQVGTRMTPEEIRQATRSIELALAAQPPDHNVLRAAVTAAMEDRRSPAIPTAKEPLTQERHGAARLQLGMETRMLRFSTGAEGKAHPAAKEFPGLPPANAPKVTREVVINPAVPGWQSTGLYAVAGQAVTVTVPPAQAEEGLIVRIGCHTDTLYHLDKWLRVPEITKSETLAAATSRISSAFGGLIYLEVPSRASRGKPFPVTVAGGVAAPFFVLGQTTDEEWNREIKQRPAPWAELACDHVILSAPSEVARSVTKPAELMEFWKKVVQAQDEISNQAKERVRPERIVADVQISAGYMHSGYPIMVPVSAAGEMLTYNRQEYPGWGFHHELGHNHQRSWFTFEGTGEVTNNVLCMYVYEAAIGTDWLSGHGQISEASRRKHIQAIQNASDKWETWKGNPFIALTTYIQLVQAFGWESWRGYLSSFEDGSRPKPQTDDAKRDEFLIRYSRIANKNLAPFFAAWGIPVSAQAKGEVAELEPWMPPGM